MAKKLSQDFGIFGDMSEAPAPDAPAAEGAKATPPTDIPNDIFGLGSEAPEEETPMEEETPTEEETPMEEVTE